MRADYETVIGLEVHVELATRTKIFCGCSTRFGALPNGQTCPVCTGMPGALPVLNRRVVEHAVSVGLACNCRINRNSRFDRKHYFYPDNPQNYQISQLYHPICRDGWLEIETETGKKRIGIHEIHMEEDAGKLIHEEELGISYVDFNRSGVPLIEIVTEPDFRSAEEVLAFLEQLKLTIQYLGASDCKMQEGSMRADVNLSVRKRGERTLGVRTEMKNLSSFRAIAKAIEVEGARQAELLEQGEAVVMETRRWDEKAEHSYGMRSKEDSRDYRYFPEPDLPPLILSEEWIEEIRIRQPELREAKYLRYQKEYQLPAYDAGILTQSVEVAKLFEAVVQLGAKPKKVSNWLMGETMRLLKEHEMEPEALRFSPEHLAKLIELADSGKITGTVAKEVFEQMFLTDLEPESYVESHGLLTLQDSLALEQAAKAVVAENPKSVSDYLGGKEKAIGFLVGQTMRKLKGQADAGKIREILTKMLQYPEEIV